MITFNNFGLNVIRLGNKLFFYSYIISIAKKFNRDFSLPDYFLWKYLKNPPNISPLIGEIPFYPKDDSFDPEYICDFFNKNFEKSIDIKTACQTELSFEDCIDEIIYRLEFKEEYISEIKSQYSDFLKKPTIGIGIRLGHDMIGNPNFYNIPHNWYIDSLNKYFNEWEQNYNIVVFSDNINEAKEIFKEYPFFYAESNDTHLFTIGDDNSEKGMNHLILGSLMNNFIISQSTFSWWQAWLCKNNPNNISPKIIHCNENFSGYYLETMKNKDYYPNSWISNKI